ncbi:hypothetical protein BLD48_06930 [Exiguobacterium sp. KRL4]|uniref:hypothetical protein n=1 Tax=Exiguobacterium sp. KRL4 TaxID=1914536 RepID=UPI0008F90789|nr:hypothetical protein [Exiguobacterium sp. KRL4]OIN67351.1 hypothetical protein BLD48_06930 [Exiguobacterium sp. KRL4]
MEQVFTLIEIVEKYGSEAIKKSLNKNNNISGKEKITLLKTVNQYWESCEVEGRGSKRLFKCSGKRKKKIDRVDNRINNGQGQLVGELELKTLVMNYLIHNDQAIHKMSATKWIKALDIANENIFAALYDQRKYHLDKIEKLFADNISNYEIGDSASDMLNEFLNLFTRSMKNSLVSVFKKLEKENLVFYDVEKWGFTFDHESKELDMNDLKEIEKIRRHLFELYNISPKDLRMEYKKESIAFKKDLKQELKDKLNLKNYYDVHYCELTSSSDSSKIAADELALIRNKFKELFKANSLELATKRELSTTEYRYEFNKINSLKRAKHYSLMWKLLLEYF